MTFKIKIYNFLKLLKIQFFLQKFVKKIFKFLSKLGTKISNQKIGWKNNLIMILNQFLVMNLKLINELL